MSRIVSLDKSLIIIKLNISNNRKIYNLKYLKWFTFVLHNNCFNRISKYTYSRYYIKKCDTDILCDTYSYYMSFKKVSKPNEFHFHILNIWEKYGLYFVPSFLNDRKKIWVRKNVQVNRSPIKSEVVWRRSRRPRRMF